MIEINGTQLLEAYFSDESPKSIARDIHVSIKGNEKCYSTVKEMYKLLDVSKKHEFREYVYSNYFDKDDKIRLVYQIFQDLDIKDSKGLSDILRTIYK